MTDKAILNGFNTFLYKYLFFSQNKLCAYSLSRWLSDKESACQLRWLRSIRKIPWKGKWQPLQYSCLENPMDRGAWWATVHRVAKSQTQLSNSVHTHALWYPNHLTVRNTVMLFSLSQMPSPVLASSTLATLFDFQASARTSLFGLIFGCLDLH